MTFAGPGFLPVSGPPVELGFLVGADGWPAVFKFVGRLVAGPGTRRQTSAWYGPGDAGGVFVLPARI